MMENCSLLLLDDDEDQLMVFTTLLEKNGFKVFAARNVEESFSILENNEISAIICDVMMPHPNGVAFLSKIKNDTLYKDLPVLMLTAGRPDLEEELLELGAKQVCLKRDAHRTLVPAVRSILAS